MTTNRPIEMKFWRGIICLPLLTLAVLAQPPAPSKTLHAGSIPIQIAFSPDGTMLASAGINETGGFGEIKIWQTATGKNLRTLKAPTGIWSVTFSPDGRTLASAGGGEIFDPGRNEKLPLGEIALWDVATGKRTAAVTCHTGMVWSVAFSGDGKILASSSHDGAAKIWDVPNLTDVATFQGSSALFGSVAFSPDLKTLASGGGPVVRKEGGGVTGEIKLWDLATRKNTITLHGHPGAGCFSNMFAAVHSLAFSRDGKILVSGGADTIELWDVASGKNLRTISGRAGAVVWRVALSADAKTIASIHEVPRPIADVKQPTQRAIRLWDFQTGRHLLTLEGHAGLDWSVAFSPDGKTLASCGGADGTIKLWDLAQLLGDRPGT